MQLSRQNIEVSVLPVQALSFQTRSDSYSQQQSQPQKLGFITLMYKDYRRRVLQSEFFEFHVVLLAPMKDSYLPLTQ